MQRNLNILICGVGGQGTILARKLACTAFFSAGYDVKASEVHGMAQRGGSVVTHFRAGSTIASPLIEEGQADYILAFEPLEALRFLPYLKKDGQLIVNAQPIIPTSVLTGEAVYPEDILNTLKAKITGTMVVNGTEIALQIGNIKVLNVVLLGVLAKRLPVSKEKWLKAIAENVPSKFKDLNLQAFEAGYSVE